VLADRAAVGEASA